jgi:hypothetical protein
MQISSSMGSLPLCSWNSGPIWTLTTPMITARVC